MFFYRKILSLALGTVYAAYFWGLFVGSQSTKKMKQMHLNVRVVKDGNHGKPWLVKRSNESWLQQSFPPPQANALDIFFT